MRFYGAVCGVQADFVVGMSTVLDLERCFFAAACQSNVQHGLWSPESRGSEDKDPVEEIAEGAKHLSEPDSGTGSGFVSECEFQIILKQALQSFGNTEHHWTQLS